MAGNRETIPGRIAAPTLLRIFLSLLPNGGCDFFVVSLVLLDLIKWDVERLSDDEYAGRHDAVIARWQLS